MQFLTRTRKRYCFAVPEGVEFEIGDVKAEDGQVTFPSKAFKSEDECRQWYAKNVDEMEYTGKREKSFDVQMKSADVTDEEWEKIKLLMTDPSKFEKTDVRVYHPVLCNNFVDRDGERFPLAVLKVFAKTLPDKPLLMGHNWGPPGEGRFFDAKVEQVSVDDALKFCRNHPRGDFRKQLDEVAAIDGSIFFFKPSFYVLKDNEEFIRKLDAGIIKDMSIGFRAPKNPVNDKDGKFKWYEYFADSTSEAMEGSFVWVGSQFGAGNRKNYDPEFEDIALAEVKPLKDVHACVLTNKEKYTGFAYGRDREHEGKKYKVLYGKLVDGSMEEHSFRYNASVWSALEARSHCDKHAGSFEAAITEQNSHVEGTAKTDEGVTMKLIVKSVGFEKEFEASDEVAEAVGKELDEAIETAKTEAVKPVQAELDGYKALGTVEEIANVKAAAGEGDKAKGALVEDCIRYGTLCGMVENTPEKIEAEKSLLSGLSVEKVLEFRAKYIEAWDKQNLPAGKTPEALPGEGKVKRYENMNAYREPIN